MFHVQYGAFTNRNFIRYNPSFIPMTVFILGQSACFGHDLLLHACK